MFGVWRKAELLEVHGADPGGVSGCPVLGAPGARFWVRRVPVRSRDSLAIPACPVHGCPRAPFARPRRRSRASARRAPVAAHRSRGPQAGHGCPPRVPACFSGQSARPTRGLSIQCRFSCTHGRSSIARVELSIRTRQCHDQGTHPGLTRPVSVPVDVAHPDDEPGRGRPRSDLTHTVGRQLRLPARQARARS